MRVDACSDVLFCLLVFLEMTTIAEKVACDRYYLIMAKQKPKHVVM
jgi:hypothetical protein